MTDQQQQQAFATAQQLQAGLRAIATSGVHTVEDLKARIADLEIVATNLVDDLRPTPSLDTEQLPGDAWT
jgi:hypothetical protein